MESGYVPFLMGDKNKDKNMLNNYLADFSYDYNEDMGRVILMCKDLLPYEYVVYAGYEGGAFYYINGFGLPEDYIKCDKHNLSIADEIIKKAINDTCYLPHLQNTDYALRDCFIKDLGINTFLARILSVENQIAGIIICASKDDIERNENHFKIIRMAASIGGLIEQNKKNRELISSMAMELDLSRKAKTDFLSIINHEIRTPMNSIIGMTELALLNEMPEDVRNNLLEVKTSAYNLMEIISDILDYSKIENGNIDMEILPFNLNQLLEHVMDSYREKALLKGIDLSFQIISDIPDILSGDATKLEQILDNLVGNAVKFTEKGEIKILVEEISDSRDNIKLKFQVKDTGIGIDSTKVDKIFDSFFQLEDVMTRKYGGTGLGLAITKHLVTLMNGSIKAVSRKNEGSNFIFTINLPAVD